MIQRKVPIEKKMLINKKMTNIHNRIFCQTHFSEIRTNDVDYSVYALSQLFTLQNRFIQFLMKTGTQVCL